MHAIATTILYVTDPQASARWWGGLIGQEPLETSPGFALFVLPGGLKLGLWARAGVQPTAAAPGGSELTITLPQRTEVEALHAEWAARGLRVLQTPTAMDFGHTFTVADPDGHRLRVFSPADNG